MLEWTWSKKGETLEKSKKKEITCDEKSKEGKKVDKREIKFIEENKREKNSERLAQREWVTNRKINPFHNKNNYLRDISIQDTFFASKE